jgi:hypothetical protein
MADLYLEQQESTQLFIENQTAILISNDPVFCSKTKHFKIKFFFPREVQKEREVKLFYNKTEEQSTDILTKALSKFRFEYLR